VLDGIRVRRWLVSFPDAISRPSLLVSGFLGLTLVDMSGRGITAKFVDPSVAVVADGLRTSVALTPPSVYSVIVTETPVRSPVVAGV